MVSKKGMKSFSLLHSSMGHSIQMNYEFLTVDMIRVPVVIQILKTWSVLKIETRVEFTFILRISNKNYILQTELIDKKQEPRLVMRTTIISHSEAVKRQV